MSRQRNQWGGAIALSVVLAMALVLLGVGFFLLQMYMGGQTETKNAVDAGTLNVSKQVLDNINVELQPTESQLIYAGVASDSAHPFSLLPPWNINLRRINRVWGEALLIGINADAAQNDGNAGSMESNAGSAFSAAQDISNSLATKLTTQANLYGFFNSFTQANSVRMIGTNVHVQQLPGSNWQTSLMDRQAESNICLSGSGPNFNLPPGYTLDSSVTTPCTRNPVPSGATNLTFLKGYVPISVANNTFWQVPFKYDEKPHSVSENTFTANTSANSQIDWTQPVPNSFSAEGVVNKAPAGEKAISWALSNPREPFQLSIPHSFLHIHLDDLKSYYYFFPTGYPPIEYYSDTYGYTPDFQNEAPAPGAGPFCATVEPTDVLVGQDVVGRNLDELIFSSPPQGDTSKVEAYMTNRANEMISTPGVSLSPSDLHNALGSFATVGYILAGARDFYLYSADGKTLTVAPDPVARVQVPWINTMISNTGEGTETKLIDDASFFPGGFYDCVVVPDFACGLDFEMGFTTWEKDVYWTPGSGYNGCLGDIRVTRYTDCYSIGVCSPLS